jgi:2'-5' RNA ligase
VFVAIKIGDRLKKELGKVQRHLLEESEKMGMAAGLLRFVKPDQLHITLAFLGQISAERQEAVAGICREAAGGIGSFCLAPGQLGAFPRMNRPAVVWVGLTGETKKLELLTKMLEFELGSRGIWPIRGTGGFAPHITIARVGRKHRRGQMFLLRELLEDTKLELADMEIPVKEITIYRSMAGGGGSEYIQAERILL